ncbi:MAG TPA: phosphate ABC transporter permease PstA [Anaerolineales bacterium]|nr:phosphate ABC transporter permease PstA [Anaerolineales bacterium]
MNQFSVMLAQGHQRRRSSRRTVNAVMLALTGLLTLLALIPLFWIIGYVFYRGGKAINLDFFIHTPTPLGVPGGGVLHAIEGTLIISLISSILAIPPGILAAFYAARHPNTPLGVALRFSTDMLSGVPSIVVGLFVYALIVVPQKHFSALAGGVALAILMLPIITRTTEEMLKLVPGTLREASLGLGAPEWKTSLSVVFPAALDGIITGFLLGIARAAGETAPLLFTALGNERFDLGRMIQSGVQSHQSIFQVIGRILNQPVDSLPLTLYKYAQQPYPERVEQSWAVALVLLILVLLVNIIARLWIELRARRLRG